MLCAKATLELHTLLLKAPSLSTACRLVVCLQMAIIMLAHKRAHRIADLAFDQQCKINHATGPQTADNFYPRSYWLMKKVAAVQDTRQVQVGGTRGEQTGTTQVAAAAQQSHAATANLLTTVKLLQQRCLLAELCACVWCKANSHTRVCAPHTAGAHVCQRLLPLSPPGGA